MDRAQKTNMNNFSRFRDYADVTNKRLLKYALGMSLLVEVSFWVADTFFFDPAWATMSAIEIFYRAWVPVFILLYAGMYVLVKVLYDHKPDLIGFLGIGAVLYQKVFFFVMNDTAILMLLLWAVLFVVFSLFYLNPKILLSVGISGFLILMGSFVYKGMSIGYSVPYLWVTMIVLALGSFITLRTYKREQERFEMMIQLVEEKETSEFILNNDELTGLKTKYALEKSIGSRHIVPDTNTYLIAINLDGVTICNELHGRQMGDEYLKVFSRIIVFLKKNKTDMVVRGSGNEFIACVSGYGSKREVEDNLNRYNRLLKEEYVKVLDFDQFIPNFSYGIAEWDVRTAYPDVYKEALKKLYAHMAVDKQRLSYTSKYIPFIDYNNLFDASSIVAFVWLNQEGWPVVYVSENVQEMLGYSHEMLVGGPLNFADLIHPMDVERVGLEVAGYLEKDADHYEQSYRLKCADGSYIWIRDHSIPVRIDGKVQQINGTVYDITEEMLKEQEIKDKSNQLNDIIQATNIGIWEWYIDSDVLQCNERFAQMAGYELDEIEPVTLEKWHSWIHEDDLEHFNRRMNDHIQGKSPYYEMECRLRHKDGHIVWVYDRGRIVERGASDQRFKMIGIQSDITEIKSTENKLYHAEKLGALGRLSGGIAHDMNNQLMMIGSVVDVSSVRDDIQVYRDNNQLIAKAVEDSRKLIHKLLAFSKHHAFMAERTEAVTLLKELAIMLNHAFEKDVDIEFIADVKEAYFNVDRSLIDNAFVNFCFNAREAMDRHGKLTIHISTASYQQTFRTYTGFMPAGDYIVIRFADTGSGIAEKDLDRIFEPFFTTKESGTGMGLSMAANVIGEHDGGVNVTSKPGRGTEFSIFLPQMEKETLSFEVMTDAVETEQKHKDSSVRIMLVDDEPVLGEMVSEYLNLKGCQVIYFEDPETALKVYRSNPMAFDLVILDIVMPKITGVEVFKQMISVNSDLQVIFLSGYSEGLQIEERYKSNVVDLVFKPVKLESLYKRIIEL